LPVRVHGGEVALDRQECLSYNGRAPWIVELG
jgi:hypothetical protein